MRVFSIFLLASFLGFFFASCRSYQFSEHGFMVENDPNYHNVRSHLSVAANADRTTMNTELNPESARALKSFGLKPKNVEVLFMTHLPTDSLVEVVAWQAEESARSFRGYLSQTSKANRYLYKKKQHKGKELVHVVYESLVGPQVGFIFNSPNALNEAEINRFLTQDVRFSHELFPDLTEIACLSGEQVGWGIDIPADLVRSEHTLLKIYQVGEQDEKLVFYTLRHPDEFYYIAFSVCKDATYRAVYSDLRHRETWSTTMHTDEIIEQDRLLMESMGYQ
ncbi:hypothetical protein M8998_13700 [Sphingobacterium sp. lm-10]|uniref:hypothetical protein n=1 Tax=Sphingobacterium sp. lm-10 TaxID=2944904 RepID=UPI0020204D3A|nr:hypothetical protein [Sphingobacterium sp. lm-10]MCL7989000.1 hypothetical protein [Sphingobacterium sp. lm-10]